MTAEQKAKELIDKFSPHSHSDWHDDGGWNNVQLLENAKQCALICVDEILKASTIKLSPNSNGKFVYIDDYWQSVRTEIINIKN